MSPRTAAAPILIADHDPFDVQLLGDQLATLGFWSPLVVFEEARDLVAYLDPLASRLQRSSLRPQLLFLELRTPAIDGFSVLAAIRREPFWSDLRIIAISGSFDPRDAERAYMLGADEFVLKPVDSLVLRAAVAPASRACDTGT